MEGRFNLGEQLYWEPKRDVLALHLMRFKMKENPVVQIGRKADGAVTHQTGATEAVWSLHPTLCCS